MTNAKGLFEIQFSVFPSEENDVKGSMSKKKMMLTDSARFWTKALYTIQIAVVLIVIACIPFILTG